MMEAARKEDFNPNGVVLDAVELCRGEVGPLCSGG